MSADGPTAARLRLGSRLRSLRAIAGIPAEQAAAAIGSSLTKVSRMESGRVPARAADVATLLDLYQVSAAAERDELLGLARESGQAGWWDGFPHLPARVRHDLSLEAAASLVAIYDPLAVPALLQSPAYARAVCAIGPGGTWRAGLGPRELARRRELLDVAAGPRVWALIGARVLRNDPAGDPRILRDQIGHLMSQAGRPEITIQVVPDDASAQLAAPGPFALLRYAPQELADTVLLEQLTSTGDVEGRMTIEHYWEVFSLITASAHTPQDSMQALAEARLPPG